MRSGKIKWGLLATGAIAKAFARGVRRSQTGTVVAVGSRTPEKAAAFAEAFAIPKAHGSYEALLADPEVEAVYISTPHPMHLDWTVKAAEAGKHILVEKPIGINQDEARRMLEAARQNGVFLMEAYMYRCHPQTRRLVELLRDRVIGDVCVISATFSFKTQFNPESRLWKNELGGGGILDVGGYTTSIARLIAGVAAGSEFADPVEVGGAGHLHPSSGVDAWAVATLKFANGVVANLATGVAVAQENVVRIYGTDGSIILPNPYVAGREEGSPGRIVVHRQGAAAPEIVTVESPVTSFAHEADVCGQAIRAGQHQAGFPAMSWNDTLGNIRTQDAWRAAIGLTYKAERQRQDGD